MEVSSGRSVWTVPPQFALWIPARTFHQIRMTGKVRMRTLYFRPGIVHMQPGSSLLYVTALLRELIVESVRIGRLRSRNQTDRALCDLLVAQLAKATAAPIGVTMPSEPRALAVAEWIIHHLGDNRPLSATCADAGVGVRTVQRAYRRELGIDIENWRRQARLTKAVQLLVAGHSVKEVSFSVGYRQPSAFVEAFRRLFNATPKAWIAALCAAEPPHSFSES